MRPLIGRYTVPGDKSISHRYVMLAALARGRSRIYGLAPGQDVRSTVICLKTLGVPITFADDATVEVDGRGLTGLTAPRAILDAGNSGTTMRLMAGVLAAHPFSSTIAGDASLSQRPMERVAAPLRAMGARITTTGGHAPIAIEGGNLAPISYTSPVASAQVKSAILLAGLQTPGRTSVKEPAPTRDHTERALRSFGARITSRPGFAALEGLQELSGRDLDVPGDPSSAAAWAAATGSIAGSQIQIDDVALNPGRVGFLKALERAGLGVHIEAEREFGNEPVGSIRLWFGSPQFFEIAPAEVPSLIDELPVLAAMAARRAGMRVTGAAELRVKESDRIRQIVAGLRALGADAEELEDGFEIGASTLRPASVDTHHDHRLAMAFAIASLGIGGTRITGAEIVDVSYPGFLEQLAARTS